MSRIWTAFAASLVLAVSSPLPTSAEPQPMWPTLPAQITLPANGATYYGGSDPSVRRGDADTIVLRAVGTPPPNAFGTQTTAISALPYRGKRIRVSGFLRSADAGGGAYWMRVDGPSGSEEMLDNMHDRALAGTHDWTPFAIVLDVPNDAVTLVGGLLLSGAGSVWADGVTIDLATPGTPPTGIALTGTDGYVLDGAGGYRTSRKVVHTNGVEKVTAISLSSTTVHRPEQFGSYGHAIPVEPYRGKRIRVSGFLRSLDADAASYWVRVDGPDGRVEDFDNMADRPLTGTHGRTPFAIVLDVPSDAVTISGGALLVGNGGVTAEDVRADVVDASVPVTGGPIAQR